VTLGDLNALPEPAAVATLLRCCGSSRWAAEMARRRPFADAETMLTAADEVWTGLGSADWHEAFGAHPRIGAGGAAVSAWSRAEQSAVTDASRHRFAALNRAYEARFGHIYIVCATGRSAADLLADLERRLGNDPARELGEAAEEQRKITRLRLIKLMT
jgi:OHCU decarboxylase